jgi:hypothetical protein
VIKRDFLVIGISNENAIDVKNVDVTGGFDSHWASCPACYALIMRGDRAKLARRSAKRMLRRPQCPADVTQ